MSGAAVTIEVRGLVKRFGAVTAVAGIDLTVRAGECLGLLGPNGAGKTTTLEMLEGLQSPTSGTVTILGRDPRQVRSRVGILLQQTSFPELLTVAETVRLFGSFYTDGIGVEPALRAVQLGDRRTIQVRHLSGGQKQRLALAVALVGAPAILFLDEPTTGMDPRSRRALWAVIERQKSDGRTIVLSTHNLEEAQAMCDRLAIMDAGRIIAEGTPADLIRSLGGDVRLELVADPPIGAAALAALPVVQRAEEHGDRTRIVVEDLHQALPAVLAAVERNGGHLRELSACPATLEDVFLGLTGRDLRDED
jgi:ABC-2 type transport system ATP-binding protein